jgi:hypothetical protein
MFIHQGIYRVIKDKFNLIEGSIEGDKDNFVFTANSGEVITSADVSLEEILAAETTIENEIEAKEAEAEAKRQALLDKLGITQEEAKLLLS